MLWLNSQGLLLHQHDPEDIVAGAELRQWGLVSSGQWTVLRQHGGYNCLSRGMWGLRECGHTMSVHLGALMPQKGLSCQGS